MADRKIDWAKKTSYKYLAAIQMGAFLYFLYPAFPTRRIITEWDGKAVVDLRYQSWISLMDQNLESYYVSRVSYFHYFSKFSSLVIF